METRNQDTENQLLKLGGMIEAKKTGKLLIHDNVNEKATDYKDMYAYEAGYHMLASRQQDDFPVYAKDGETGLHKLVQPAQGEMPHL